MVCLDDDGDEFTPRQRQDGDAVQSFPGQDALVIDDGTMGAKDGLLGLIALEGFVHLGNRTDGQLSGESKVSADLMVDKLLEENLIGGMLPAGNFCDGIACSIEACADGIIAACLVQGRYGTQPRVKGYLA